ncbi:SufE protein probably involved in Fe-S center assembly [Rheinheimera sp. A13L]|uniref:SufE family protein n=1 Tax=Rheinheimera sp. A13L TaxID=506534 RepID=UPI0002125618|nr:SufE family protein [Rheinheimera sp. A13L]EGM77296.1 SufE protein probably involved in Fe-S center assembly [Rheinheimera sp. A13L]
MIRPDIFTETAAALKNIYDTQLPELRQLKDWQSRYRILMTLGKALPVFDSDGHRDEFLVQGCESKAWLLHYQDPVTTQHFWAFDSDARIVKGLIILILAQVNGLTAEEFARASPELLLNELQLQQNISPSRSNGLLAVLTKIKNVI